MAVKYPKDRPEWFPSRLWWPGEPLGPLHFTIREAGEADAHQVRQLLRDAGRNPPDRTLIRWLTQHGYVVRIACRGRYAVAVCASRHNPSANEILVLHVAPEYGTSTDLILRLALLAVCEIPERPGIITLSASSPVREALEGAGWRHTDGDGDRLVYRLPARVRPDGGLR